MKATPSNKLGPLVQIPVHHSKNPRQNTAHLAEEIQGQLYGSVGIPSTEGEDGDVAETSPLKYFPTQSWILRDLQLIVLTIVFWILSPISFIMAF